MPRARPVKPPPRPVLPGVRQLVIDAHVHFYPCFDRDVFFDSATANVGRTIGQAGLAPGAEGVLLLTETPNDHFFDAWALEADGHPHGRWTFRRTDEDCSLIARSPQGARLVVVAGQQVPTAEGLEVLAIGSQRKFVAGMSLREAATAVRRAGAITILPWGFGKWWFRRGALVQEQLQTARPSDLFLGDNGGRLGWLGAPALFRLARAQGVGVLPGSDPLPFPEQVARVASYTCCVEMEFDPRRPASSLKRGLHTARVVGTFGRTATLGAFWHNQLRLQLRKRRLIHG